MKKVLLILVGTVIFITGCSSQNKDIDISLLADNLLKEVKFDDTLTELDSEMISKIYEIDNAKRSIVYIGSGATAEEIALFEFDDNTKVSDGYLKVQKRVEQQKKDYANYIPKEVVRLDKAIIEKRGNYVILCITDEDKKAQEIIDKFMK